jgi:phosphoribosylformylglycinamidine synthase
MSSEVQKGNAVEERKIQRLFRNPEVTRLIKNQTTSEQEEFL